MNSDDEYLSDQGSERSDRSESSEMSQNESGDYPDEIETSRSIESELGNITETLKSLTDAKYSLINTLINRKIDPVIFAIRLNEINNEITDVGNAKTPLETELATKEFEYSYKLNGYSDILKSRTLSVSERKELERLTNELKTVRSIYSRHFQPQEPTSFETELVSNDELDNGILDTIKEIRKQYYKEFSNEGSSNMEKPVKRIPDSIDINWVVLTKNELEKMHSLAKSNKIHIPKMKEYKNATDFEIANSFFYKQMLRYLPISVEHIGITSIKTIELIQNDEPYQLYRELKQDVSAIRNIGKLILLSDTERNALRGRNYNLLNNQPTISIVTKPRKIPVFNKLIVGKRKKPFKPDYFSITGSTQTKVNKTFRQRMLFKRLRKNYTIRLKGIILDKLSKDILNKYLIFKNLLINTDSIQLEKMIYNHSMKRLKQKNPDVGYYTIIIKRLMKILNDTPDLVNKVITRTVARKDLFRLLVPQRVAPVEKVMQSMKQLSLDPTIIRFEELTLNKSKTKDTIEAVLYNPYTGSYSREAYNGYLFQVYRLNKNKLTGQPYTITVPYEELNPRTGSTTFVMRTIEQDGPTPYIKFPLDMGNTIKTVWREVNINDVKNYPLNYDTCERFTTPIECNSGRGLGNKECIFRDNRCKVKLN